MTTWTRVLVLAFFVCGLTGAATLHVPAEYATIQAAIDDALAGDTVLVAPGEYVFEEPLTFRGKLIALRSEAGSEATTLRANVDHSVVVFEDGETRASLLEGFTIRGGRCGGSDDVDHPGIYRFYVCSLGGIVCKDASSPTILRCTITGSEGSAIVVDDLSAPLVKFCEFSHNGSAGIFIRAWSRNEELDPPPHFIGCTIQDNNRVGMCCWKSTALFEDCVFARNGYHGVYCAQESDVTLSHCTVAMNHSQNTVAGVRAYKAKLLTIDHCIIWGNMGGSILTDIQSARTVRYTNTDDSTALPGTGNTNLDPLFCGWGDRDAAAVASTEALAALLESYSFALHESSPCLAHDMGASRGTCDHALRDRFSISLVPGTYQIPTIPPVDHVTLTGAGPGETILEGCFMNPGPGTVISSLSIKQPESGYHYPYGAIIRHDSEPMARFENCVISGMSTGVYSSEGAVRLEDCTIHECGWGIEADDADIVLEGCNIQNNTKGGISVSGIFRLTDTLVAGNDACGINIEKGSATLEQSTIAGNYGPGILEPDYQRQSVIMHRCIVWGNAESGLSETLATESCIQGDGVYPGGMNINADPMFQAWGGRSAVNVETQAELEGLINSHRFCLAADSPCLQLSMGADRDTCILPGESAILVRLGTGNFDLSHTWLANNVSVEGAGMYDTFVTGPVRRLRTGASLSHLTVHETKSRGLVVDQNQSPEIHHVRVTGSWGTGILCSNASPVIRSCIITDNSGEYEGGGGLLLGNSSAMVLDTVITGNGSPQAGHGIHCWGGSPTFEDCVITDNHSNFFWLNVGGGLYLRGCSMATFRRCTISRNSADWGAAAAISGGSVLFEDCTITEHEERVECMSLSEGEYELRNCVINGNNGTGIKASGMMEKLVLKMTNCLLAQNLGGIEASYECVLTLTNCTVADNDGYELKLHRESEATIKNCIIWGDQEDFEDNTDNGTQVAHSCIVGDHPWPGTGNLNMDPLFRDPSEGDYRLQRRSQLIDAGTRIGAPNNDLDGNRRPCGQGVDMGAYESCFLVGSFIRGDANVSGTFDLSDVIYILNYLFANSSQPPCLDAADTNDDGAIQISDAIMAFTTLFRDGGPLPAPYEMCDGDPTEDLLDCKQFEFCKD